MPIIAGRASAAYGAGFGAITSSPAPDIYGSYDALATSTVPTGGVASVIFSGIPDNYRHLELRYMGQNGRNTNIAGFLTISFNNTFGSNYFVMYGGGGGGVVEALQGTPQLGNGYQLQASGIIANTFGVGIVSIPNYSNGVKHKTIKILSGADANGSGLLSLTSYLYNTNNPIQSITIQGADGATIQANSTFALYGVK